MPDPEPMEGPTKTERPIGSVLHPLMGVKDARLAAKGSSSRRRSDGRSHLAKPFEAGAELRRLRHPFRQRLRAGEVEYLPTSRSGIDHIREEGH